MSLLVLELDCKVHFTHEAQRQCPMESTTQHPLLGHLSFYMVHISHVASQPLSAEAFLQGTTALYNETISGPSNPSRYVSTLEHVDLISLYWQSTPPSKDNNDDDTIGRSSDMT